MDGDEVEIVLELEGGSGGKESGENTVANLAGYRVFTFYPTGDKESRAYPFASQVGAEHITVLNRPWTRDYIEEFRFFPNSKFKDQVDASSAAFNRLSRKRRKIGSMWKVGD
jgi:predicted phage terminase large subunit-like protein